jgi:hypothetical protein
VRFGAARTGLLMSATDMDAALPASNAMLAEMHERLAVDTIARMSQRRFALEVREVRVLFVGLANVGSAVRPDR